LIVGQLFGCEDLEKAALAVKADQSLSMHDIARAMIAALGCSLRRSKVREWKPRGGRGVDVFSDPS
jgi:hypothetical protein